MVLKEQFIVTSRYKTVSRVLMGIGIVAIIALYITHGAKSDPKEQARFWGSLLQNSVYFLLVVNAVLFFICATTLSWGGWQMSFRRVSEAIATSIPLIGIICGVILMAIVFGGNHEIYHWTDAATVKGDEKLLYKSGFLNKGFFTFWTVFTIAAWSLLEWKLRKLSRSLDDKPAQSVEEGKKYIWTNTVWSAIYIVVFSLTVMSVTPWLWLMSIEAHWFSTMYSWYTFGSTFVAGLSLITLYVVYLKNNDYLELANQEHLHDLGKFIFAFSIFWAYLWFDQFMLIWYSNIPEETTYFKPRGYGIYSGIFWLMLIINFVGPILILMSRGAKRNYATITFISISLLFGHWLNFFQMVFPGFSPDRVPLMIYDLGIGLGFAGLIMHITGRSLSKAPMYARNHPFIKESIIHHT